MKKLVLGASVPVLVLSTFGAHSAGFEKGVSWGAASAGRAGAAVSTTTGPEALYFNPAGLASGPGFGASLQFSPTWVTVSGPAVENDTPIDAARQILPFTAVLGNYGLNDRASVGLGVFVSGGLRAIYDDLDVSGLNANFADYKGSAKSQLTMIEASLGGAYRIMPGLKVGAAWRAAFVTGTFASTAYSSTDLGAVNAALAGNKLNVISTAGLQDLSAQNYAGFRIGAQYEPEGSFWGVGLNIRTPQTLTLKGTTFGKNQAAFDAAGALAAAETTIEATNANNVSTAATGGAGTASSTFPTQIALGSHFDFMQKKLRLHVGYTWSNYKKVDKIAVDGAITTGEVISAEQVATLNGVSSGLGTSVASRANNKESELPDFETAWKDEHIVRFAVEYMGIANWVLRTGYGFAPGIVPANKGRATFSAPGSGHTLGLGAGTTFLGEKLLADLALEYSWSSGTIEASTANGGLGGAQKSKAIGLHMGATYLF